MATLPPPLATVQPSPSLPAPARSGRGYQVLICDVISSVILVTANNDKVMTVGALSLSVTPLIIHAANQWRDLPRFGTLLRLGLPALAGLGAAGVASHDENQLFPRMDGFIKGALVGLVAAMIIDWSIASRPVQDGASVAMADSELRRSRGSGVTAGIAPLREGASLLVGGHL